MLRTRGEKRIIHMPITKPIINKINRLKPFPLPTNSSQYTTFASRPLAPSLAEPHTDWSIPTGASLPHHALPYLRTCMTALYLESLARHTKDAIITTSTPISRTRLDCENQLEMGSIAEFEDVMSLPVRSKDGVKFGRELREKDFLFEKGYLNLNHGEFGWG